MPVLPPAGTRLVLMHDDLAAQLGTLTEDGRRLQYEWGEPDGNGWYAPTVSAVEREVFEDEVLFLTSNSRIFDAACRAYRLDGTEVARHIIRHLIIPTPEEAS